jgi:hypothetical protein
MIEVGPEDNGAPSPETPLAELLGLGPGTDQLGAASLSEPDRWLREPRENISGVD